MRILIHSNSPTCPSGYGVVTATLAPRLAKLGHQVAISAFCGLNGAAMQWNGITVFPGGFNPYGNDIIAGHAATWKADLVLTIMDAAAMEPQIMAELGAAHWMPVDCTPLGIPDTARLRESGASVIAISEFGRDQLADAGFAPYYIPHGIETSVFRPLDKAEAREKLGIPQDAFVIGLNAANADPDRKALPEQFMAFAALHQKHDDVILAAHTLMPGPGMDLGVLAARTGIDKAVRPSNRHKYSTGGFSQADMAVWYSALDLFSGAARAEGFGLPLIEAAACGIPVVATDGSAMTEIAGPAGWLVEGEPYWNKGHCAMWFTPHVEELAAVYEAAYDGAVHAEGLSEKVRAHALKYDADALMPEWEKLLGLLEEERA